MDALPVAVVTHMAIPTTTQIVLFWFCRVFGLIWLILSFSLFFRILTIDYTAKKEVPVFLRIPLFASGEIRQIASVEKRQFGSAEIRQFESIEKSQS